MTTELAVVVTEVTLQVTIDINGPIDLQQITFLSILNHDWDVVCLEFINNHILKHENTKYI